MKTLELAFLVTILMILSCETRYGSDSSETLKADSAQYGRRPQILLWEEGAPGSQGKTDPERVELAGPNDDRLLKNIHYPSITPFIPNDSVSNGAAMIIAPGGGHVGLWIDHLGYDVARKLSEQGIAAFVLKYRLAKDENSTYKVKDHAVLDMQRAIQLVRYNAQNWKLDESRIGVLGFSAGGEVAYLTEQFPDISGQGTEDEIDEQSSKPDFHILIYPVRSHQIAPTEESSPVLLMCGYQDNENISRGLAEAYLRYKDLNIPAELHIYSNAGHGFTPRKTSASGPLQWMDRVYDWLKDSDFLKP